MNIMLDNDNIVDLLFVFIIIGKVYIWEGEGVDIYVMLMVLDDDMVVCMVFNVFVDEGFIEVDFDQIGMLMEIFEDELYVFVFQGVFEGEVVIIWFV